MELQPMPIEHLSNERHHSDPPNIARQPLEQNNTNNSKRLAKKCHANKPNMVLKLK